MRPEAKPVEFSESEVPLEGIDETAAELIDYYGGALQTNAEGEMAFTLPSRRGVAASGSIRVVLTWAAEGEIEGEGRATLRADSEVDAPRTQRVAMLALGAIGALLFLSWPFFPEYGELAVVGGLLAFAAYLLTLKKTRGGVVYGFLQELVRAQRMMESEDEEEK